MFSTVYEYPQEADGGDRSRIPKRHTQRGSGLATQDNAASGGRGDRRSASIQSQVGLWTQSPDRASRVVISNGDTISRPDHHSDNEILQDVEPPSSSTVQNPNALNEVLEGSTQTDVVPFYVGMNTLHVRSMCVHQLHDGFHVRSVNVI